MRVDLKPTYYNHVTLTPDEVQSYHENGYLIVKNLAPNSDIAEIRNDAIEVYKRQLRRCGYNPLTYEDFERDLYKFFQEDLATFMDCGKHMQHTVSLHRLALCPQILEVLKRLGLTSASICTRPVMFMNSKHLATKDVYHTVPAHQDALSMQGSSDSVVVWFPLVNMKDNLGTIELVPRSHKHGLLTSRTEEGFGIVDCYSDEDFIAPSIEMGDALFFSSFLVHRSGKNLTDSIRFSCHFRFNNLDDPDFIERKFPHPYIYKPISKGAQL